LVSLTEALSGVRDLSLSTPLGFFFLLAELPTKELELIPIVDEEVIVTFSVPEPPPNNESY
jgi:hypothetical protein